MDMRLEVVILPVSDVDRAKDFYTGLGWREDADIVGDGGFRIVQVTPPASGCSRVEGLGLETFEVAADAHGIPVDARLQVRDGLWAIGDVTGLWPLTHVGEYQGDVVAANILGRPREASYEAVPRVVFTDPQAASVGAADAPFSATTALKDV